MVLRFGVGRIEAATLLSLSGWHPEAPHMEDSLLVSHHVSALSIRAACAVLQGALFGNVGDRCGVILQYGLFCQKWLRSSMSLS